MATHIFAAIDVGSFELELGIYEISSKNVMKSVDHLRHVIALGRDTYDTGKISYELVDEMCEVLGKFTQVMEDYQVEGYQAYGTSAMREAKNNQIILDQIFVRTGIRVKIISNSEQRFLSYKAMAMKEADFQKMLQKGTAIADVSFGSMQLSLFDKDSLVSTQNIGLGILRIQGILSKLRVNRHAERAIIEEMINSELDTFKKLDLGERQITNLVGLGESIVYLTRDVAGAKRLHWISTEDFVKCVDKLMTMTLPEIEDFFGVGAEYAGLLVPSAIIYKHILEMTGAQVLWVPGIRLCDGIAAEYAQREKWLKFSHKFDNDILVMARNMSKRYYCSSSHVQCIEGYVLRMFDAMKKYHGMDARQRLLLQIATLIHDCGKFVSMRNSSECAYNIIMATEIIGLSHQERKIVASVVRYNLEDFDYNKGDILVAKLTAMLRLANALDRSHCQKLKNCKMAVKGGELVISTEYKGELGLEAASVQEKSKFFEEIFGIRPVLKQKRRV